MRQVDIKEKVKCIACGYCFYMIVTENGKTYGWGLNTQSQMGNSLPPLPPLRFLEPSEIEIPGKIIGNSLLFKTYS